MGMLKRALACVLLTLVWLHPARATEVVLYGDDAYPPYAYVDDSGQFVGIYVALIKAAASKMGPSWQVRLQPVPWQRGRIWVQSGRIFALFPPYRFPARNDLAYSLPLYTEHVVVFCRHGVFAKPHPRFPDDFKQVTIGINAGFLLPPALMQAHQAGLVNLHQTIGTENSLWALARHTTDCYANDRNAVRFSLHQLRMKRPESVQLARLVVNEVVELSRQDTYIAYGNRTTPPYKTDFIRQLDDALAQLNREGEAERIVRQYVPSVDQHGAWLPGGLWHSTK